MNQSTSHKNRYRIFGVLVGLGKNAEIKTNDPALAEEYIVNLSEENEGFLYIHDYVSTDHIEFNVIDSETYEVEVFKTPRYLKTIKTNEIKALLKDLDAVLRNPVLFGFKLADDE